MVHGRGCSTLANGVQIPAIGFGTWQIPDGNSAYDAVAEALTSFEETITELGLDYADLYLIHAPWPWSEIGTDHRAGNAEAWRAMEAIHDAGRARALGVSNFNAADLTALRSGARLSPQVNQIRFFVGHTKPDVTTYCQANGILVEGYSPLATGAILGNAEVLAVAQHSGRSVAQICIRYVLQKGVLPLPKTSTPSRMSENADTDFEISAQDMTLLDSLTDTTN